MKAFIFQSSQHAASLPTSCHRHIILILSESTKKLKTSPFLCVSPAAQSVPSNPVGNRVFLPCYNQHGVSFLHGRVTFLTVTWGWLRQAGLLSPLLPPVINMSNCFYSLSARRTLLAIHFDTISIISVKVTSLLLINILVIFIADGNSHLVTQHRAHLNFFQRY